MKSTVLTFLLIGLFSSAIAMKMSLFVVTEGEQAIITIFGKPVGETIVDAGLHFKIPWQDVRFVDKRILTWDGSPNQIPTKDKKYIRVDTTARWQIVDALKFIQAFKNESGAEGKLKSILDSATRDVISNNNLVEAVRNTNSILDKVNKIKDEREDENLEEEITGEIEAILVGREKLSEIIAINASEELKKVGINLIDLQLRRISYEKSVEQKVYERMISERQRIAQKIRSVGQGEKAKIEGRLRRDLQKIESEAYKQSQEIRGEAEAKATKIYAQSFTKGKDFYEFRRSLEAYDKAIKETSNFILSTDSEFLKVFTGKY